MISDVIYYKVKIRLNDDLKTLTDLKDGLTANVVITTDKRSNALLVPARAIIDKDGVGKVVRILEDAKSNKIREVSVGVGITGNDNLTEITSGSLNTGEAAITYIKDPNTP